MPETVKEIAKKAEVSHMVGIITHCAAHSYIGVQGGFENSAHFLMKGHAFFTSVYLIEMGILLPRVVHPRQAEISSHLPYYAANAASLRAAFIRSGTLAHLL